MVRASPLASHIGELPSHPHGCPRAPARSVQRCCNPHVLTPAPAEIHPMTDGCCKTVQERGNTHKQSPGGTEAERKDATQPCACREVPSMASTSRNVSHVDAQACLAWLPASVPTIHPPVGANPRFLGSSGYQSIHLCIPHLGDVGVQRCSLGVG